MICVKTDEELKVIEDYLKGVCRINFGKKIEMPEKFFPQKPPTRRIVSNNMDIRKIMKLRVVQVQLSILAHNIRVEEQMKVRDYILQLFDFSDEFLVENVLEIKSVLPIFVSDELRGYILKYIDLRIQLFESKKIISNGKFPYRKIKKKPEN